MHAGLDLVFRRPFERQFASIYNDSDGLVVLSEGLRRYWRERGVTAPIHVIPRAVQPRKVFDRPLGEDPYSFLGTSDGPRLLCAGRHTREKSQDRVIRIFAQHVLPEAPNAAHAARRQPRRRSSTGASPASSAWAIACTSRARFRSRR
ncbi:MAG: hypothetical protein U0235_26720 [Polyangiaceae bacterium]